MAVTPADIAVALGRTTPADPSAEFSQWELWIGDALMLIGARLGDVSELDQDVLDYVVREAVVAQVRRPDDATSVDVRVDDAAVSKTYRSSSGRVAILDDWWKLLAPPEASTGAFSFSPYGCTTTHQPWCSLAMGASYCSCGSDLNGYIGPLYELD